MILELQSVEKGFQQGGVAIPVLKSLNLGIQEGETVAILGPSGSGKTTLLSLITGLDAPDRGNIKFQDTSINSLSEEDRARFRARHVGIVFQQYHLLNYLTAFENVALPLELINDPNSTQDIENKAHVALKAVGLENRENHFPYQLSGGENQRVAIARALITAPKLLVADEPSGSLDEKTGAVVMNYLFDLVKQQGTTLLLVTHNEELAKRCSRIVRLHEGQIR